MKSWIFENTDNTREEQEVIRKKTWSDKKLNNENAD